MNNKQLFINLVKKIEYSELEFYFEGNEKNDKENELYLHDPKTGEKIYLFTLWIDNNDISVFCDKGDIWEKVNSGYKRLV
jgi:hypothetical protein